jgi:hypothetical protein
VPPNRPEYLNTPDKALYWQWHYRDPRYFPKPIYRRIWSELSRVVILAKSLNP